MTSLQQILSNPGGTFCGVRATQVPLDYHLWETLLNEHPDAEAILELGTAYGGFSLFLKLQAQVRGLDFLTFDISDHSKDPLSTQFGQPPVRQPTGYPWLDNSFHKVDLLNDASKVQAMIQKYGKIILFCDNGHKAKEVELYAPYVALGSLVIVHDWNSEIGAEDIPEYLTPLYENFCDTTSSWTRVFQK